MILLKALKSKQRFSPIASFATIIFIILMAVGRPARIDKFLPLENVVPSGIVALENTSSATFNIDVTSEYSNAARLDRFQFVATLIDLTSGRSIDSARKTLRNLSHLMERFDLEKNQANLNFRIFESNNHEFIGVDSAGQIWLLETSTDQLNIKVAKNGLITKLLPESEVNEESLSKLFNSPPPAPIKLKVKVPTAAHGSNQVSTVNVQARKLARPCNGFSWCYEALVSISNNNFASHEFKVLDERLLTYSNQPSFKNIAKEDSLHVYSMNSTANNDAIKNDGKDHQLPRSVLKEQSGSKTVKASSSIKQEKKSKRQTSSSISKRQTIAVGKLSNIKTAAAVIASQQQRISALESLQLYLQKVWANRQNLLSNPNLNDELYRLYSFNINPTTLSKDGEFTFLNDIYGMRQKFADSINGKFTIQGKYPSGFFHFMRPAATAGSNTFRIYVNPSAENTIEVMSYILDQVVARPDLFPEVAEAKVAGPSLVGKRADSIVIYTGDSATQHKVAEILKNYASSNPGFMLPETPAATEAIAPGIGMAETPRTTSSFGSLISKVTESSLRNANDDFALFQRLVSDGIRDFGMNPQAPNLNLSRYGLADDLQSISSLLGKIGEAVDANIGQGWTNIYTDLYREEDVAKAINNLMYAVPEARRLDPEGFVKFLEYAASQKPYLSLTDIDPSNPEFPTGSLSSEFNEFFGGYTFKNLPTMAEVAPIGSAVRPPVYSGVAGIPIAGEGSNSLSALFSKILEIEKQLGTAPDGIAQNQAVKNSAELVREFGQLFSKLQSLISSADNAFIDEGFATIGDVRLNVDVAPGITGEAAAIEAIKGDLAAAKLLTKEGLIRSLAIIDKYGSPEVKAAVGDLVSNLLQKAATSADSGEVTANLETISAIRGSLGLQTQLLPDSALVTQIGGKLKGLGSNPVILGIGLAELGVEALAELTRESTALNKEAEALLAKADTQAEKDRIVQDLNLKLSELYTNKLKDAGLLVAGGYIVVKGAELGAGYLTIYAVGAGSAESGLATLASWGLVSGEAVGVAAAAEVGGVVIAVAAVGVTAYALTTEEFWYNIFYMLDHPDETSKTVGDVSFRMFKWTMENTPGIGSAFSAGAQIQEMVTRSSNGEKLAEGTAGTLAAKKGMSANAAATYAQKAQSFAANPVMPLLPGNVDRDTTVGKVTGNSGRPHYGNISSGSSGFSTGTGSSSNNNPSKPFTGSGLVPTSLRVAQDGHIIISGRDSSGKQVSVDSPLIATDLFKGETFSGFSSNGNTGGQSGTIENKSDLIILPSLKLPSQYSYKDGAIVGQPIQLVNEIVMYNVNIPGVYRVDNNGQPIWIPSKDFSPAFKQTVLNQLETSSPVDVRFSFGEGPQPPPIGDSATALQIKTKIGDGGQVEVIRNVPGQVSVPDSNSVQGESIGGFNVGATPPNKKDPIHGVALNTVLVGSQP